MKALLNQVRPDHIRSDKCSAPSVRLLLYGLTLPALLSAPIAQAVVPIPPAYLLSFGGTVDESGATLNDINAPLGSAFTLDVVVDNGSAAVGEYPIQAISYTLTLGTYTTTTSWTNKLVATGSGSAMTLQSIPPFDSPDEHFLLSLSGFGTGALFDDPSTWDTGSTLTGDIIVRGVGGFESPDQLSGIRPYLGTLALVTSVPEPTALTLLGLGSLGWVMVRRKR